VSQWESSIPVLSIEQAQEHSWHAVMIPGAGFSDAAIAGLDRFRQPSFGLRVQHILNDRSRLENFIKVNRAFCPELVIFNNRHWPSGSLRDLQARQFHVLEGAVDPQRFFPKPSMRDGAEPSPPFVIAGQARKNPRPLIDALRYLPDEYRLVLFGEPSIEPDATVTRLEQSGRLVFRGAVQPNDLPAFYHSADCVVHVEHHAGWANLVAEAMASGVPVICTTAGTLAMAKDGETALLLHDVTGPAIAKRILQLFSSTQLRSGLVERARRLITRFDWNQYTSRILELTSVKPGYHDTYAPELGLHGQVPLAQRYLGFEALFGEVKGTRILHLGCRDGVVARACLDRGAESVLGFDSDPELVHTANRVCPSSGRFFTADTSSWSSMKQALGESFPQSFDVTINLECHRLLDRNDRLSLLAEAFNHTERLLVLGVSSNALDLEEAAEVAVECGFHASSSVAQNEAESSPRIRYFVRKSPRVSL
jgi:hypothetical protein